MKKPNNYTSFVNERVDRIGSKIRFLNSNEEEIDGKIVNRKKDGSILVLCLSGRNKGNSKIVSRDNIIERL